MIRRLIPFALGLALALAPLAARPVHADAELERAMVESASTPAQHAALARYYERKAASARQEAENHRAMGKSYAGTKLVDTVAMKQHCEKLAALYTDQAAQYDDLAKLHAAMGK